MSKKSDKVNYLLRYEFPFYIDTVPVDMSDEYSGKMIGPTKIREYIHRRYEYKNLDDLEIIEVYFDIGIVKKIFGIFPSRESLCPNSQLDCLHIAFTCNLDSYIQSSYVVIEFINKAIELDDPAIIFDQADRIIKL